VFTYRRQRLLDGLFGTGVDTGGGQLYRFFL
jgi:hypothetical protein